MDYEKAYEEAMERAKAGMPIDEVFPELKESEDEKIRKAIVKYFKSYSKTENIVSYNGVATEDIIAYLEKQKELPTNEEMLRTLRTEYEKGVADTIAKYKQKEQKPNVIIPKFRIGDTICLKGSMAEYTIESIDAECYHGKGWGLPISAENNYELVEQKPVWNEEEKQWLSEVYFAIDNSMYSEDERQAMKKYIDFLRPQSQPKPAEWSEEDEKMRNAILQDLANIQEAYPKINIQDEFDWLKDIPERFNLQPKQDWSKEDEKNIENLDSFLTEAFCYGHVYVSQEDKEELQNWLKSLRPQPHTVSIKDVIKFGNLEYERGVKDGIQSEKSRHWKPSEEQMNALSIAIRFGTKPRDWEDAALRSLYNGLKKLL